MPPRLLGAVAAVTAAAVMLVGCTKTAEPDETDGFHGVPTAVAGGDECVELVAVPCLLQVAAAAVEIPGTTQSLHYRSDRMPGRTASPRADILGASLGGWTLAAHQMYVPEAGVLLAGDGTRRTVEAVREDDLLYIATRDGKTLYEFDEEGRHLRTLSASTGDVRQVFEYDDDGRLVGMDTPSSHRLGITWAAGSIGIAVEDVPVMSLELDEQGLVVAAFGQLRGDVDSFTYDDGGLLASWASPLGQIATYAYDDEGRLAAVTSGASVTEFTAQGRRVSMVTDGEEILVVTRPDGRTGRWQMTDATGATTSETVREDGRRDISMGDGTEASITFAEHPSFGAQAPYAATTTTRVPGEPESSVTRQTIAEGAVTAPTSLTHTVTDSLGTSTTVWDADDRTFTMTSAEGRVTTVAVDAEGALSDLTSLGSTLISVDRDADGKPTSVAALGGQAGVTWEGRTATVASGDSEQQLTFGADTSVASVTDGVGRVFSQDMSGRALTSYLNGEVLSVVAGDELHSTRSFPNAQGGFDTFTIDIAEGAERITSGWDGGTATAVVFDEDGTLLRLEGGSHDTSYTWDAAGELSALTRGDVVLTPDASGTAGTWSIPGGPALSVAYLQGGAAGRSSVSVGEQTFDITVDRDGELTGYGPLTVRRDPTGRVISRSVGAVTTRLAYDDEGLESGMSITGPAGRTGSWVVERDEALRLSAIEGELAGEVVAEAYAYDAAGRLVSATRGDRTWGYSWDTYDNLIQVSGHDPSTVTVDRANRVTARDGVAWTYNADHALAERSDGLALKATPRGALEQVTLPDGRRIDYLLDGAERRVARLLDGAPTDYFTYYDELRPAAHYDADGRLATTFVYDEQGFLAAMVKDGREYAVLTDQVGTPLLIVDAATGEVAQRLSYDAFGQVLEDTSPGFQPLGFLGAIADPQTGLVSLGAREYDPQTARFLSPDPILETGSRLNLYGYAKGDPVNAYDRNGLASGGVILRPPSSEQMAELQAMWDSFTTHLGDLVEKSPLAHNAVDTFDSWNKYRLDRMPNWAGDFLQFDAFTGTPIKPSEWQRHLDFHMYTKRIAALSKFGKAIPLVGGLMSLADMIAAMRDMGNRGLLLRNGVEFLAALLGIIAILLAGVLSAKVILLLSLLSAMLAFCFAIAFCARAFGEPHMVTADGAHFSYQGVGEFWAVRSRDGSFDVQVRQEPLRSVAFNTAAAVRLGESVVELYSTDQRVVVDGVPLDLVVGQSHDLGGGAIVLRHGESAYRVLAADGESGIEVDLRRYMPVTVAATEAMAAKVGGLYGTFDGNPENDWTTPDGTVLEMDGDGAWERLHREFGPSWRVAAEDLLLDGPSVWDPGFPEARVGLDDLDPEARRWAEGLCRATGVTLEPFLRNCTFDVGYTGDPSLAADAADASRLAISTGAAVPAVRAGEAVSWVADVDGLTASSMAHDAVSTDEETLFVTLNGAPDAVVAIDGATGAELWRVLGVNAECGPLVLADGRVAVVASAGSPLAGGESTALVTLDPADGRVVDTVTWPEQSAGTSETYCLPSILIDDRLMLVNGGLGDLTMWDVEDDPAFLWSPPGRSDFSYAAEAVPVSGGFVIKERVAGKPVLRLVEAGTGEVLDSYEDAGRWDRSELVGDGDIVVLSSRSAVDGEGVTVDALQAGDRRLASLWSVEASDDPKTAPGSGLRAFSISAGIVAAEGDENFVGLDARRGSIVFMVDKPSWHNHDASTTVIDGKLYNSTAAGIDLYVIDTASGNLVEYRAEDLFDGESLGADSRSSYRFGPKVAGNVPVFFHGLLVAVPAG
jgi:RHS repeat-associated protein